MINCRAESFIWRNFSVLCLHLFLSILFSVDYHALKIYEFIFPLVLWGISRNLTTQKVGWFNFLLFRHVSNGIILLCMRVWWASMMFYISLLMWSLYFVLSSGPVWLCMVLTWNSFLFGINTLEIWDFRGPCYLGRDWRSTFQNIQI